MTGEFPYGTTLIICAVLRGNTLVLYDAASIVGTLHLSFN